MGLLYGRTGRLTAENTGFRPGQWTDSLEGTVGVATHHDGISGTERQAVADDYSQRIAESAEEVETGVGKALQHLLGTTAEVSHCGCNQAGSCLNMTVCQFTTDKRGFTVVAWNPLAQAVAPYIRVPVTGARWSVRAAGGDGQLRSLTSQTEAIDERTKQLPLLYLDTHGMGPAEAAAGRRALANNATHVVSFRAALPPIGYGAFVLEWDLAAAAAPEPVLAAPTTIRNGVYELTVGAEGVEAIRHLASDTRTALNLSWGWYESSTGGCTALPNSRSNQSKKESCSPQSSGAYIFRPASRALRPVAAAGPTTTVLRGPLVTEVRQRFSGWATHVVRLYNGSDAVEVEWTAGPIPPRGEGEGKELLPRGKELVLKYATSLASGRAFATDSNGREMVPRLRDGRGPSYPPLEVHEPVAGNY
jgi:alpha-mannosidase